MKKNIIIIAVIILISTISKAQQLPLYSQYIMNGFLLNPAIAGSENYTPIRLTVRMQWIGIDGAPTTQAISAHSLLKNKVTGVGGYLFNDKFGPFTRTGIQAAYSHHLKLNKDMKLALGLSLTAVQIKLDQRSLTLIDDDDPAITGKIESKFVPDANFGAYLYTKDLYVGLASAQLMQWKIKFNGTHNEDNTLTRHYFINGGYRIKASKEFTLEPSVLIKATEYSPIQADVTVQGLYKYDESTTAWLGFSYRSSDAYLVILGLKFKQYYFGYSYDVTLSNIKNYSNGSHEIVIGYNIYKKGTGSSLL